MMDAGALVYFSIIKDFAHVAGVYDVNDWMTIDARANRFRPLFNDEFARDFLGEMVGLVSLPSQRLHDYALMNHKDAPVRYLSHIPYAVLTDQDSAIAPEAWPPGVSHLGAKADRYVTTQGPLMLVDYNARAAAFRPRQMADDYRFLCDTSVRHRINPGHIDALYRLEQEHSATLKDRGSGLSRTDIDSLRDRKR
jgi:hypothetical protein